MKGGFFAGIVTVGHADAFVSFGEIGEEVPRRLKLQVFLIVTARLKVVPSQSNRARDLE
jgi:hypothetical protein